jgi:hypothetical protein
MLIGLILLWIELNDRKLSYKINSQKQSMEQNYMRRKQQIVASRGPWRLTGHKLLTPEMQTFLHVCLVFL